MTPVDLLVPVKSSELLASSCRTMRGLRVDMEIGDSGPALRSRGTYRHLDRADGQSSPTLPAREIPFHPTSRVARAPYLYVELVLSA